MSITSPKTYQYTIGNVAFNASDNSASVSVNLSSSGKLISSVNVSINQTDMAALMSDAEFATAFMTLRTKLEAKLATMDLGF